MLQPHQRYVTLSSPVVSRVLSLQFEEKQLELWTKKVEEYDCTHRVLKERHQSLAELLLAKQAQASQLEQVQCAGPPSKHHHS